LLDEGAIGQPQLLEIRQYQRPAPEDLDKDNLPWRLQPASGGGKDLDIQVHVLDYLAYYFGDITAMTGIVENRAGLYEAEGHRVGILPLRERRRRIGGLVLCRGLRLG
jgi:predicted dehydrogenase